MKVQNAVIEKISIETERGLSAWLHLDYGDSSHQGFGGYTLYSQSSWEKGSEYRGNYAGHFIKRCIEIGGVDCWEKLIGKNIRVRKGDGFNDKIDAIGHIIKDDWFDPSKDFEDYAKRVQDHE